MSYRYLLETQEQKHPLHNIENISIEQTPETRYCSYSNSKIPPYAYGIHLQSSRHTLPSVWISLEKYSAFITELKEAEQEIHTKGWTTSPQNKSQFVTSHLVSNGSIHCAFCEQDLQKNTRAMRLNNQPANNTRFGPSLWYHYKCYSKVIQKLQNLYTEQPSKFVTTLI